MSAPPRLFDRSLRRSRLDRAATTFAQAAFLWERSVGDHLDTLRAINRRFPLTLDLGARTNIFAEAVKESDIADRFDHIVRAAPTARLAEADAVVADEEALPFGADVFDLIVSTLALHSVNDLPGALVQARLALKADGLFIGSLLGGETLHELRVSLMEAEMQRRGGTGPRVAPVTDGADLIELMKRAGFAMPVVDTDRVRVSYAHPLSLVSDLRRMGETNILHDRPRKGLSRAILARMADIYAERFSDEEGRVTATFEIITLSGWKPHESQQKPLKPGSAKTRLADALGAKEIKL